MPKGIDSFRRYQERQSERQAEYAETRADYFGIVAGQAAQVRFLEQGVDLSYALVHRVPRAGSQYPQDVLCCDQEDQHAPCPGCESEFQGIRARQVKGFVNLIWRNGPVWKRDEYGRPQKDQISKQRIVVGTADGIFLWKCSKTVFYNLIAIDDQVKGLMSRDFTVTRQGSEKENTKYVVFPTFTDPPMAGPQPMTVGDQTLANQKYDLDKFITPPSYEEFATRLRGNIVENSGPQPTFDRNVVGQEQQNVFLGGPPIRSSTSS